MIVPKIFIVIVTWNGMKWMKECLESIRKSTIHASTVIIDNGSTDSTCEFIKKNYPEINLLETGKNLGFGQANNVGIRYALDHGADYVYLLNQDAYIYPNMFEELIKISENPQYTNIGIYSPLHIHGSRRKLDRQFKGYLQSIGTNFIEDISIEGSHKSVYTVDCVPAAGWLLPVSTINKIGGFDPIFFHYGEDHHYAQRIRYHGMRVGVVPTAKMIHDREGFGNETMAKCNQILRNLETEIFLNINYSAGQRVYKFLNTYFFFSLYSFKEIRAGNWHLLWEEFSSFFKILIRQNKYRKNRKINKQLGMHWLPKSVTL